MTQADLPASVASAIEGIYEAGFEPARWQQGLTDLCRAVGAESAVTVPKVGAENTLLLPSTPGMDDFLERFVTEEWYRRDLRAERGWPLAQRGRRVVLEQDIVTPDDHAREPLYQDFCRRYGMWWWAGITFRSHDRDYVVSLFRAEREGPFSERDRQLFGRLTGHLSRALSAAELMAAAAGRGAVDLLQAMGSGGILVDAQARIIAFNTRAEALLGDGLSIVGNRLVARSPDCDRALQRLIVATLRHGPQPQEALAVRRRLGSPILVDALPIPTEAGAPFLFGKALLVLVDLEARRLPPAALLMQAHGLTRREADLAVLLAAGRNLVEAAEELEITRETARSHLKSLFAKTDTNRQSALVSLLQRTRSPLR